MPRFQKKIKRLFGVVFAISNSIYAICSGAIEQIQDFGATHSEKKPANRCVNSIQPQSPVNTQDDQGLVGVAFGAIGGVL